MHSTAATSICTATGYWGLIASPKERSWACCCAHGRDWSDAGCRAGYSSILQREDGYGRGDEASVEVRAGHPPGPAPEAVTEARARATQATDAATGRPPTPPRAGHPQRVALLETTAPPAARPLRI